MAVGQLWSAVMVSMRFLATWSCSEVPLMFFAVLFVKQVPREDPVITAEELPDFDGLIFGIPTRFGMMPAQAGAPGVGRVV